jgi:ELWxxDGT repeat protein
MANVPNLVSDINQVTYGANPNTLLSVGDRLYFLASNDINGTELWQVDKNTGTVSLLELYAGSGSPNISNLTNVNGTLYFTANGYNGTTSTGYELWRVDPVTGIPTVIDIYSGSNSSSPRNLTNIGGTLYFVATGYDGTTYVGDTLWKIDNTSPSASPVAVETTTGKSNSYINNLVNANGALYFTAYSYEGNTFLGTELWKLDPTTGKQVFVKDINNVDYYGSSPGNITYSNGKIYFTADDHTHGIELWETDGTTAGTKLTQDLNQTTYGSSPTNFFGVGNTLYFTANDDVRGVELWKADKTTGLASIIELYAGSGSSNPSNFININGTVYFTANGSDGTTATGNELWKLDPTTGNPIVLDIYVGNGYGSNPSNLTNVNGTLYFTATGYDGTTYTGQELWRIDSTTGLPTVIDVSSNYGGSYANNLTNVNGILYFQAYTQATGYELWKVDPANNLPILVSDLYPGGYSSSPTQMTKAGGVLYFTANNGSNGTELFQIDATGNLTLLDIRTGANGSNPSSLTAVGDVLYFIADDGVNGSRLWQVPTTGTPGLVSIEGGGSNPRSLTSVNGKLYFTASDTANGVRLWKIGTNGTAAVVAGSSTYNYSINLINSNGVLYYSDNYYSGLWKVDSTTDTASQIVSNVSSNVVDVNGALFFSAYDGTNGYELWKIDTEGNPSVVKDIRAGGNSSYPTNLYSFGDTLYFTADDGIHGAELWKSDGTAAGTVLAQDINGRTLDSNPSSLTDVGGILYFIANDGVNGSRLWKVDPTTGTPGLVSIEGGGSNPRSLNNVNGKLYFTASDASGVRLWKIGTNGSAAVITGSSTYNYSINLINSNGVLYYNDNYYSDLWKVDTTTDTASQIVSNVQGNPVDVNGTLFFSAYDGTNGYELWKLDSSGNPSLVKDIRAGGNSSSPDNLYNFGGTLYFTADNGINGVELWKSDGTATGTVLTKDINGRTFGSNPSSLTDVGGILYFIANDGVNGSKLWKVDPTTGTPGLVSIAGGGSNPRSLNNINGKLYFTASDADGGVRLWKIGTSGSAAVITGSSTYNYSINLINSNGVLYYNDNYYSGLWKVDTTTDTASQIVSNVQGNPVDVNGTLFFSAYDGTNGYELWKLDSSGNPTLVKDIYSGGSSYPSNLYSVNGTLYFTASNATDGYELWKSDGTAEGTVELEIYPGSNGSNPSNFLNANGVLYFIANNATSGQELWRINATTGNPELLDINSGSGGSAPSQLTNIGGTLYFQAYNPTNGYELWKVAPGGTPTVIDLYTGTSSSSPNNLTNVNGTLYFTATTYNSGPTYAGTELWKIEPTGTPTLIDVVPGSGSSYPSNLTNVNGVLYFTADSYDNGNYIGRELWQIDKTTGGAVFLKDIQVGSGSSNPGNLTYSNGKLYFTADDFAHGIELWTVDVDAINTVGTVAKSGIEDESIPFTAADFSGVFSSSGGATLAKIKITQLPSNGVLKLGTEDVTVDREVTVADLGNLKFVPNANFNGTVGFSWNGSDGTAYATNPSTVNISISSVNDAPTIVSPLGDVSIYSNRSSNFSFASTAFQDVDLGDALTYTATLADGSPLPTWLTFNDRSFTAAPQSANAGSIEIKITAKDQSNATATDNFIVSILNSAPNYLYLNNYTIPENTPNTTQIGTFSTNDYNTNDTFTYTLIDDAGGRFALDGDKLVVANGNLLDYETNTYHTIRVRTTDNTGLTYEQNLNVNISNVIETSAGILSFTSATYTVNEDGTPVTAVTVQRTGGSDGAVQASIYLTNGTATYPQDYSATAVTVSFAGGETSKVVNLPIYNDTLQEPDETIKLTLANPLGGAVLGAQQSAILTIPANDVPSTGTIAFDNSSYSVGENGTSSITLIRTGGSEGAVSVTVNLTDGTATAANDYTNTPVVVSFANGETSKTISIPIVNDAIYETTETINLSLSAVTNGAALGTQKTAVLSILDNDPQPTISIGNVSLSEGNSGTTNATFAVSLSNPSSQTITVDYATSDVTATAGSDYTSVNQTTLTFAPGETTKNITVSIIGDSVIELDETFKVDLSNATNATLGTVTAGIGTIVNDDNPPAGVLSFGAATYSFDESGTPTATVTIDRTNGSGGSIGVTIGLSGGTATAGIDYVSTINVAFANGETSKTVTIPIINDTLIEPTETVNLSLTNPTGGATISPTQNTAVASIVDDDVQLSFSGASYRVNENGTAISDIMVSRTGRATGAVSATLSFSNGTATGCVCAADSVNNDFYNGTFVVNFADGETVKVIPVQLASLGGTNSIRIRDDGKVEGDEYFSINLISPTGGATIGTQNSATVTIVDNDTVPQLSVTFDRSVISETAGTGAATGTVTRAVAAATPLVVTLASSDTTEATVPQQVTIAAGQTSATFSIEAIDDTIIDGTQPVTITATPINPGTNDPLTTGKATANLEVTDNESPILSLTIDREIIAETGTATATVTRNTNTSTELVVTLTSNDTTEATVPQTVTIPIGQTSVTFAVSGVNDGISDGSQPATITAAASGFVSGIKAISVSDIDVPDLVITKLDPALPIYTSKQSTFTYRVENKGITAATAPDKLNTTTGEKEPWLDRVYLSTDANLDSSDKLLGEFPLAASLLAGSFYERNITYYTPRIPGNYYLIGTTDATNKIGEGVGETNNTVITPFTILPSYKATVSTAVTIASIGSKVLLTGQATSTQNNSPIAYEFVKIKVENKGIIRELDAFTDASGNFTSEFQPLPGEAGTFNLNAYFPNNPGEDTAPEDSFKILGMRFEQNDQALTQVSQQIRQGNTFTGTVKLQNLSDVALTGLTSATNFVPNNWTVNINPSKQTLAGNEEIAIDYSITVPDGNVRNNKLQLLLNTTEGVTAELPITIDVVPIVPKLVASTNLISSGMLRAPDTNPKNQTSTAVEFTVTNEGGDTAKNIKVVLPDATWLSLASVPTIPTLAPGESTKVILQLRPGATLPLTEYKGNISLDVEGNDGDLSVPFNFRAVSSAIGNIQIDISDELTYFTEGAPKLKDAKVQLLDYFTKAVVATSVSDGSGLINFADIPEGAYELEVKADNHETFRQAIQLDAGELERVNAFLSRQTVRYTWTVTPTEIQDKYKISIESTFETNVPVPTIVVDPPLLDLEDLTVVGQVKQIEMTMTNHGLIAAQGTKLNFGNHPFYKIETLINDIGTISAKSSVKVPVRIYDYPLIM